MLVFHSISPRTAAQIDKIFIKFSLTRRADAEFVGAFKKFGALVVRLEKDKLADWVKLSDLDGPPRMKPFWEARVRKRFGAKHVDLGVRTLEFEVWNLSGAWMFGFGSLFARTPAAK